jgi:hypothetical protein
MQYWGELDIVSKNQVNDEWSSCLKLWHSVNNTMFESHLPIFQLQEFRPIDEVLLEFK